ncbi:MAG: gamma carbonic anhydrase family protein [Candidatus Omnitrophica bacterium]|nr:gamma carbonic anhydrase family protein [Candidatus Omnitrophota bacterium]
MNYWPDPIPGAAYKPDIHATAYIAPLAYVGGRVEIGEHSSVWPGCSLRGDINKIVIGKYTNIQDCSIAHVENDRACVIGNYVTVGHRVLLHGCTVEDEVLVGMGSILMNGVVVGKGTIIGAGSLVTEGKVLEPESLYLGSPARKVRTLTKEDVEKNKFWAEKYAELAKAHMQERFLMA